jgi:hypothetical protein
MTKEQEAVLVAAYLLAKGGLDDSEIVFWYDVISKYVRNNPPKSTDE